MAAWMLYMTAHAILACVPALIAERGAREARWPTRFVWLVAMVVSVAPVAALALAIPGPGPAAAASDAARSSSEAILNGLLLLGWAASSIAFVAGLRLSAWRLRRWAMSWRTTRMAGETVLISTDMGPGVVGARRPRTVVPRGVLAWEEKLQRLVVAHEREHVRAGDQWVHLVALGLVALAPWCLPLWWQLHRLREAVESDCDARVVAATGAVRDYAGVVLALAGRRGRRAAMLTTALAPGVREVERRIREIVGRRCRSVPRAGGLLVAAGLLTMLVVISPPRPEQPYFGLERSLIRAVVPEPVREPPSAIVILRFPRPEVEPEGENP